MAYKLPRIKKVFALALAALALTGFAGTRRVNADENELIIYDYGYEEYVTIDNLNLRAHPSMDGRILETVPGGTVVRMVTVVNEEWCLAVIGDRGGYMNLEFLLVKSEFDSRSAVVLEAFESLSGQLEQADRDSFSFSDVKLVEWSDMKTILPTGVTLNIFDVRTGITYNVASFSNGVHADVEPITPVDTATLLYTYNGIWDWDTRPVLVTFNGKTYAASINGMPHAGSSTFDNGVEGHFCLHFLGSKTNNGNKRHENDHQNCVKEAYDWARR